MSRVVMVVMVAVMGLWVVGQAINTKRMVERHHATLVASLEVVGK